MFIVVFCTCHNISLANELATKLIETKLAACVNVIPEMSSVYTWEQKLESSQENLLIIKTMKDKYNEIEQFIKDNHEYSCPEIIAIPILCGSEDYLNWVKQEVE